MNGIEAREYFENIVNQEPDVSVGLAGMRTLMELIRRSEAATVQELQTNMKEAIEHMKNSNVPVTAINSGCEQFGRHITLAALDAGPFSECKKIFLQRGSQFITKMEAARGRIAKCASKYISDGLKILTHSKSRVVQQALAYAHSQDKKFHVYVTISAPDNSGKLMFKELSALGIPCTLILDSALGYIMEKIDIIMVGAEGVAESGGIVNKVGTYTMAMCAKVRSKRFYVLAESFKFIRVFPLNQQDLPTEYKYTSSTRKSGNLQEAHPLVDYTPPEFVTLLFTDIGNVIPSAVSAELMKLYL